MTAAVALPALSGSTLSDVAYAPGRGLSFEDWAAEGETIARAAKGSMWWLGDWLAFGDRRFGEDRVSAALAVAGDSGLEYSTVTAARWLALSIPAARRRADLSWSHHREVGSLPDAEQDRWLATAAQEGMTRAELRDAVREMREAARDGSAPPGHTTVQASPSGSSVEASDREEEEPSNVVDLPRRSITAGYDDSPGFLDACQLRFGMERGGEVYEFTCRWARKYVPELVGKL